MVTSSAVYSRFANFKAIDNSISIEANQIVDTGIKANSNMSQKFGYLFLIMGNISDNDNTYCKLYLVRTGYSGNYVTPVLIAQNGNTGIYSQTIDVNSQGNITITSNIKCRVCIF